ncbi:hypothetical protein J1605_014842, partial [Eschrichtius robustus]
AAVMRPGVDCADLCPNQAPPASCRSRSEQRPRPAL